MSLAPPPLLFEPVQDADNCSIEFESSSAVVIDADGYPQITTETVTLRARVYTERTAKTFDIFPEGTDIKGELLWGRLNDPLTFPETVKDLSLVRVTFDDGRVGTARLKIKTQNAITQGAVIGQKFNLLFRA
jgi:hypothetical protein